jgi:hypothetical protein
MHVKDERSPLGAVIQVEISSLLSLLRCGSGRRTESRRYLANVSECWSEHDRSYSKLEAGFCGLGLLSLNEYLSVALYRGSVLRLKGSNPLLSSDASSLP